MKLVWSGLSRSPGPPSLALGLWLLFSVSSLGILDNSFKASFCSFSQEAPVRLGHAGICGAQGKLNSKDLSTILCKGLGRPRTLRLWPNPPSCNQPLGGRGGGKAAIFRNSGSHPTARNHNTRPPSVHLQRAYSGHQDDDVGHQPRSSALDVEEFLHSNISPKASFRHCTETGRERAIRKL